MSATCFTPSHVVHVRRFRPRGGRILISPPKARGSGPRLLAEHQPQRHGEASIFGIIRGLCSSVRAAAGPSDTVAFRWWKMRPPGGEPGDVTLQLDQNLV